MEPFRSVMLTTSVYRSSPFELILKIIGDSLASSGDDGVVLIWVPSDTPSMSFGEDKDSLQYEKEFWKVRLIMKFVFGIWKICSFI